VAEPSTPIFATDEPTTLLPRQALPMARPGKAPMSGTPRPFENRRGCRGRQELRSRARFTRPCQWQGRQELSSRAASRVAVAATALALPRLKSGCFALLFV